MDFGPWSASISRPSGTSWCIFPRGCVSNGVSNMVRGRVCFACSGGDRRLGSCVSARRNRFGLLSVENAFLDALAWVYLLLSSLRKRLFRKPSKRFPPSKSQCVVVEAFLGGFLLTERKRRAKLQDLPGGWQENEASKQASAIQENSFLGSYTAHRGSS